MEDLYRKLRSNLLLHHHLIAYFILIEDLLTGVLIYSGDVLYVHLDFHRTGKPAVPVNLRNHI